MSGALIEIVVDDRKILRELERLAKATGNLRPALKNIGDYLQRSTWERFDAQKDPSGKPWAPLHPVTLARKKGKKILVESSRLRDSVVYRADDDEVRVGTNVAYAAIHQFGGKIKPRGGRALFFPGASHPVSSVTIPARPFLGISDEDRSEILDIIRDHVSRAKR